MRLVLFLDCCAVADLPYQLLDVLLILFKDQLINRTSENHFVMNVSLGEGIWALAGIWTSSESLMRNPHQISSQQVEVVGVSLDEAREKTVPAMDQWVTVWDQEFETPLTVPKLAMLVIEVKEFKRVHVKCGHL